MNKGVLFIAPPGAGKKRDRLFKEIVSSHSGNDYSSVLYLAPNSFVTSAARTDFFTYVQTHHKQNAFIPFQVQTIRQLAESLHEIQGEQRTITDRLRVLILCEILKENSIGYATILADLYKKIRHYLPGLTLEQVKGKIVSLIFEEKAADRAAKAIDVLQKYDAILQEKNLIDPEGVLGSVMDKVHATHDNLTTLVIDGFFDPTPLELEIIGLLIDKSSRVLVLAEEETEIIRFLTKNKKGIVVQKPDKNEYRKQSAFYSYPSIEEEVEGIAKNIKKLIIEGTKPWDITVCFPVLTKYLPMVKRILPKFGIPISIGEYRLSASRPFMALEEMITCIEGEYSRSDFLSFLTSPHFPAIPAVIREKALSYAYRAGVVEGRDSWLAIRDTLINAHRGNISDDEKTLLNEFQDGITMIINTIEEIKGQKEAGPFIDAFESALAKFGFFDSLTGDEPGIQEEKMLNRISGQIAEFKFFAGLYGNTGRTLNKPVFYLKYLLTNLTASEENRDGVKITPLELAAGIETKVLFFGGILEGDFPSRPGIDPILPERVKKELGMPYLDYYLKRQKRYFSRLLNVSEHPPYFSCPSAEGDKIFLPSPFLDWEQSMPPLKPGIFSEEEALIREGAIKRSPQGPGIFNDREMFRNKETYSLLLRRIGAMSKGTLSVTDIDFYRKCPLRFYIEKVLGLEVIIPPSYEVEARLWGNLAHNTMEHVFEAGSIKPEELGQKISEGLKKSLKQFPIGDFWAKVAKEIFRKLLPSLKAQESDIQMEGFAPYKMEEKLTADLDGLKLKGKVDRIDIKNCEQRTPNDEGLQTVSLLDYKTGNIDRNSLQLALYAAMWQQNFNEPVEKVGYYSLKEGKVTWLPGKISMDEYIESAVQSAQELITKIRKGKFSAEPFKADECRYCYHSSLCNK